MKGFIRTRGDAWDLRVFLGTDSVTNKKRYASKPCTATSARHNARSTIQKASSIPEYLQFGATRPTETFARR